MGKENGKLSLASIFPESLAGWEDDREGTSKGVIAGELCRLVESSMCLSGCFVQDNGCVVNGSIPMVGEYISLLSVMAVSSHVCVCKCMSLFAVPLAVSHMYVCLLV